MSLEAQIGTSAMFAIVLAASAGAGLLVWTILTRLVARARKTPGDFDDAIWKSLRPALTVLALLAVLTAGRNAIEAVMPGRAEVVERVAIIALVATAAWGAVRVVAAILERTAAKQPRMQPAARLGSRLLSSIIYAAAFLMILAQYGISITPLLTGLGIATLVLGLALQDTLSNFFAGVWIQSGRTLQPGHFVRLEEDKVDGFVKTIGWRTTLIKTLGGNTVVIPNAKLAQALVTDFSWPSPEQALVINFRFPYDFPPEKAMEMLVEEAKEAAKAVPGLVDKPEPFANINPGFGDWGMEYSLIVRIQHYTNRWDAQSEIRRRVWHRWAELGIEPPYPSRPPGPWRAPAPDHWLHPPEPPVIPAAGAPPGWIPSGPPARAGGPQEGSTAGATGDHALGPVERPARPPPNGRKASPPSQPPGLSQQETPQRQAGPSPGGTPSSSRDSGQGTR